MLVDPSCLGMLINAQYHMCQPARMPPSFESMCTRLPMIRLDIVLLLKKKATWGGGRGRSVYNVGGSVMLRNLNQCTIIL